MTDKRPVNCRHRLVDEGKPYPKSNCAVSGCGGVFNSLCKNEEPQRPEDIRRDEEAQKTYDQHEINAGRSVVISKAALYALMTATMASVARKGAYRQVNDFGEIEIADAIRAAGEPLNMGELVWTGAGPKFKLPE